MKKYKRGQILMEILWTIFIFITIATSLTWMFEKSKEAIEKKRIGKWVGHELIIFKIR